MSLSSRGSGRPAGEASEVVNGGSLSTPNAGDRRHGISQRTHVVNLPSPARTADFALPRPRDERLQVRLALLHRMREHLHDLCTQVPEHAAGWHPSTPPG